MELISRDEAIKTARMMIGLTADERENEIRAIPTVEERKEGEWIPYLPEYGDMYKCSKCKGIVRLPFKPTKMPYKFCPNCGKKMKGE